MKNILFTLLLLLTFSSCVDDNTTIVHVYPDKVVKLNAVNLLTAKETPMFAKGAAKKPSQCSFPAPYDHPLPDRFNVFFIDTKNSDDVIKFEGVEEGTRTYEVKAKKYRVVVTNANDTEERLLDKYSTDLYLYGQNTIDFSKNDSGTVTIGNPYASVMVVDNDTITNTPELQGNALEDVGEYFNIYTTETNGKKNLTYRNSRDRLQNKQVGPLKANEVYRYLACQEAGLTVAVDNIFEKVNDEKL